MRKMLRLPTFGLGTPDPAYPMMIASKEHPQNVTSLFRGNMDRDRKREIESGDRWKEVGE